MGDYQNYRNSEHWQAKRREKQRTLKSGRKVLCERCHEYWHVKYMHTHHKHYDSLGNESMEDLECLCQWCHAAEHGKTIVLDKEIARAVQADTSLSDGEMNERRNTFLNALPND